jgi:hypothetical protein
VFQESEQKKRPKFLDEMLELTQQKHHLPRDLLFNRSLQQIRKASRVEVLLLHRLCLCFHPSAATTKPQIYISKSQKKTN